MKTFIKTLALTLVVTTAHADLYVSPYTRDNGTYVQGYYRSAPNNTPTDNYSYPGNYNPRSVETPSYSVPSPSGYGSYSSQRGYGNMYGNPYGYRW